MIVIPSKPSWKAIDESSSSAVVLNSEIAKTYTNVMSLREDEPLLAMEPSNIAISKAKYLFFTPRIRKTGQDLKTEVNSKFKDAIEELKKDSSIINCLPTGFGGNNENISLLKHVTDVELLSIANEVMGDSKLKRLVQLTGFSVSTGIGNMPYAFIKLNIDGNEHTATDYGVGPVDASLNAIQKITDTISEIRIKDYNLASISGGSSALCEVTVKLEDAMQNMVSSKSIGEDIVITSVQAVIDGMNRIMLKKLVKQKKA